MGLCRKLFLSHSFSLYLFSLYRSLSMLSLQEKLDIFLYNLTDFVHCSPVLIAFRSLFTPFLTLLAPPGPPWGALGAPRGPWGVPPGPPGGPLGLPGVPGGSPGSLWRSLGAPFGRPGAPFGSSWGLFGVPLGLQIGQKGKQWDFKNPYKTLCFSLILL